MTSFKRTQRKYVQKAYRVRNWREYETGLRARGSLTVWLGLTMASSPTGTRRGRRAGSQADNASTRTTVCHEGALNSRKAGGASHAAWKMRDGPSGSGCRLGSQTTSSCWGQEPWW